MGDAAPGLAGGVVKGAQAKAIRMPPAKGAVHSAEIEYALGNLATNKVYAWTPDDYKVSEVMQAYFANFIKSGDPNGPGLPAWPPANRGDDVQVLHIDVRTRAEPDAHDASLSVPGRARREEGGLKLGGLGLKKRDFPASRRARSLGGTQPLATVRSPERSSAARTSRRSVRDFEKGSVAQSRADARALQALTRELVEIAVTVTIPCALGVHVGWPTRSQTHRQMDRSVHLRQVNPPNVLS